MLIQQKNKLPSFSKFLILAGSELFIAGLLTSLFATQRGVGRIVILSAVVALAGIAFILVPLFLKRSPATASRWITFLDRYGHVIAIVFPVILSGVFFLLTPGKLTLQIMSGLLVCIWLIGLELLFFFGSESDEPQITKNKMPTLLASISMVLAYGILLLPSRIPSFLDGIPWNTPAEFIAVTLLLPFTFITAREILGKKFVIIILALLFTSKFLLMFILPQAGLGVRAYFSEEALQSGSWERSYGTFLAPGETEITMLPYLTFRDFPVEWINHHSFEPNNFWMALELNGFITLQEDERFVFLILGAPYPQIDLTAAKAQKSFSATIVRSADELDAETYRNIAYVKNVELHGVLIYTDFWRRYRLEPLLLYPDGSTKSALPNIWSSSEADKSSYPVYRYLPNFINIALTGILLFCLMKGIFSLYKARILRSIDLYLAATSPVLYYLTDFYDYPNINLLFLVIIGMLSLIIGLDLKRHSRENTGIRYLFSIGIPILFMFLSLDLHTLQSIEIFPTGQDSLEYQMLAHNIYVNGDIFLAKTPPWAYKVLFPYIIGFLHILFGQSVSAQFFLSAWCAILSAILISRLLAFIRIPAWGAMLTSILFPMILLLPSSYNYYFRFGLIEPLAIFCLLAAYYFAFKQRIFWMFVTGMAAALLRLNFIGAILAAAIFIVFPDSITGSWIPAWKQFFEGVRKNWKLLTGYLSAILAPTLLITLAYSLVIPNYTLSPNINKQTSIGSVLESLQIVIVGGDTSFLYKKLQENSWEILLIAMPVAFGFLLAGISSIYRKGFWKGTDLRLSLVLLSFLPVYAALKPIAYFPRYSWSPLPYALIIITASLFQILSSSRTHSQQVLDLAEK